VGAYKVDYFDIKTKVLKEEEDPELEIKVPGLGFNTSVPRFKEHEVKKCILFIPLIDRRS
jgi:hypothetical protein